MNFGMKILASLTVAAATLAGGSAAQAATGQATAAVHVRSGPSTGYSIVDVLSAGERVEVDRCTGGWCHVSHSGPDGWVSSNYLAVYNGRPQAPNPPQPGVSFCIDAPNFQFGTDCRPDYDHDRGRPDHGHNRPAGQVCFYKDYNYRGASFCARPGQADARLGRGWNDTISSIRVQGGATAQVCEDWNYRGRCSRVNSDIRAIGGRNNDIISSYRIR